MASKHCQESGQCFPLNQERSNSPKSQDDPQRFQEQQPQAQEAGSDKKQTLDLLTVDYKPKEMQSQKQSNDVHELISRINSELRDTQELSDHVPYESKYTSQHSINIKATSPQFKKLNSEKDKVFSKPEIQIQELDNLTSRLKKLEENLNIVPKSCDEYQLIHSAIIPGLRNELENKKELCELLTQYNSSQHDQIFSKLQTILAQGIDGLMSMLENLQQKQKIEDSSARLLCKEDTPVPQVSQSQYAAEYEGDNCKGQGRMAMVNVSVQTTRETPKKEAQVTAQLENGAGHHPAEEKEDVGPEDTTVDEVDERSIVNEDTRHVNGQEESLPVSSEEQSSSLIKGALSTMGRVVDSSVQTDRETPQKETQVTVKVEIGTDPHPTDETETVSQEDTTEAATAEQMIKKEEEVVSLPKEVTKSYAEVLKSVNASCSPAKQQIKGTVGMTTKKAACLSSPAPAVPTPSSAPSENLKTDGEGWQVVQERCSTKARLSSKSDETEQSKKKFDIKDHNRFSVLIDSSEDLSAIDDDTVSDTEAPGRRELGSSSCATRMTASQKKRKTRKSAGRRKKIIRGKDEQPRSRRKPTSNLKSGVQVKQTQTSLAGVARFQSKDVTPTDQKKMSACKRAQEEQQGITRIQRSRQSRERSSKRSMVDGNDLKIKTEEPVHQAKRKTQQNSTTEKSALQVKQTKTSMNRATSLPKRPPLDHQPKGRYSLKDVSSTDPKKKKSAKRSKRDNPVPGNSGRQEEQLQTRSKKKPNTPSNVSTGPGIPRSGQGRESRSSVWIGPREEEGGTAIQRDRRGQDQWRKIDQAVRPKIRERRPEGEANLKKTAVIFQHRGGLNNERASQRRQNIRCPDYGTIKIVHNPLPSTSSSRNLRRLSLDGLNNNMRGMPDHREEFWRSGLSAVESARHWALPGKYTENRVRRMDRALTQLLSSLPDQNISLTRATTEPNGDGSISNESPDVTPRIQQQKDCTIYKSGDEGVERTLSLQNSDSSRNHPTSDQVPTTPTTKVTEEDTSPTTTVQDEDTPLKSEMPMSLSSSISDNQDSDNITKSLGFFQGDRDKSYDELQFSRPPEKKRSVLVDESIHADLSESLVKKDADKDLETGQLVEDEIPSVQKSIDDGKELILYDVTKPGDLKYVQTGHVYAVPFTSLGEQHPIIQGPAGIGAYWLPDWLVGACGAEYIDERNLNLGTTETVAGIEPNDGVDQECQFDNLKDCRLESPQESLCQDTNGCMVPQPKPPKSPKPDPLYVKVLNTAGQILLEVRIFGSAYVGDVALRVAEQVFNSQPLVAFTLRWQDGYNTQPLTLLQHDVTLQVHHAPDEDETWVWRIIPTP